MGKTSRIVDRWLIIGIAILMVAALLLLGKVLSSTDERESRLDQMVVEQAMEAYQHHIQLVIGMLEQGMKDEADRLIGEPIADGAQPPRTWLVLMRNKAPIRSIGLADDQGNAWALYRVGGAWNYQVIKNVGDRKLLIASSWTVENDRIPEPDTIITETDPRLGPWFSQALEGYPTGMAWSFGYSPSNKPRLYLSSQVAGDPSNQRLYILRFGIAPETLLNNEWEADGKYSTICLNAQWQPITTLDSSEQSEAWRGLLAKSDKTRSSQSFETQIAGKRWVGRLAALPLQGLRLQTGIMVGTYESKQWSHDRQVGLWSLVGLMLLLGIFITVVLIQSTNADRRARRQSKRSDLQARHLAETIVQREVLDREVHHRVKNNLQVVSSLLNLQAQRIPDQAVHQEFLRGKRRIDAMALVHHKLYKHKDLSAVDLQQFIEDIAAAIAAMFESDSHAVSYSVIAGRNKLNADTTIQLGMLLCELLANCYQHAFPYATGGHIDITVEDRGEGLYSLVVSDNGKGFDTQAVPKSRLGLEVVEALAEQLDGTVSVESNPGGTRVEVLFRAIGGD